MLIKIVEYTETLEIESFYIYIYLQYMFFKVNVVFELDQLALHSRLKLIKHEKKGFNKDGLNGD